MKKILLFTLLLCSMILQAQTYKIYPVPQKMTLNGSTVELTQDVNIIKENGINNVIENRIREVLTNAGISFSVSNALADDKTNILIGINGSKEMADNYATSHSLSRDVFTAAANKYDAHLLQINNNHAKGDILILGDDTGSAYYGMATLEQILEQTDGNNLPTVTFEDYAHTQYRGIVEGFYGHPYSTESRLNLLDYCKRYKMNMFVYGPKADPYHAGKWRENYPTTVTEQERHLGLITQDDLRALAAKSKACNVAFIWSIHPALEGGGINFSNLDPGVEDIMEKFDHLYQLGIRHFGVSIDDMSGHPSTQADLANKAQVKLYEKFNTDGVTPEDKVGPLLFVPTVYALNYGSNYILNNFKNVHQDLLVAFTGYDCFSNIRGSSCDRMADLIGRNPIMWWNNPVNDDYDEFLYMHGLTARWIIEDKTPISSLQGLVLNPMNQGQVSKIALFSSADYAWNPEKFNESQSWEASLTSILPEPELTEALKTFIGVMSAYTTHDTKKPEGEKFSTLYTAFQSAYSKDNLPDATQLLSEMKKANEACKVLQTLKDSENETYRLFYEDIECWLAKVESMTDIVVKSISLMKNGSDLSSWTDFADAQAQAQNIHTDPAFQLSVLEGNGTNTYEVFKEVQPTPKYLDPFIDFLAGKIGDYAPTLPERSREMEVITNIKNLSGVGIQTEDVTKLSGLDNVTLKPQEYVGIFFNAIKEITTGTLPASLTNNLTIEHSINGKEWTAFIPDDDTAEQMAYFRIRNNSSSNHTIPTDEIAFRMPATESSVPLEATTNMKTYQSYNVRNVIDGNLSTKFWSDGAQKAGDYIQLDFGSSAARFDITLHFADGDTPTGEALIQLSDDAQNWTTVKSFTAPAISNSTYVCSAGGKSARYVRLYLQSASGSNWFQLTEFEVTGSRITPVAEDHEGNPITLLDDRSLAAGYRAQDAGYVIYRFIENISIDEILIFHNSTFIPTAGKPVITVRADGEWIGKGELDAACTSIQVSDLKNISQLKIAWNRDNIPSLYEIMPVENASVKEWTVKCSITGKGSVIIKDEKDNIYENGAAAISDGTYITLTFVPEPGYKLTGLTSNGKSLFEEVVNNKYDVGYIDADHTYEVSFADLTSTRNTLAETVTIRYETGALYVDGMEAGSKLDIYAIAGNHIRTSDTPETDVSDLANGCYLVKVSIGNTFKTMKFIKR